MLETLAEHGDEAKVLAGGQSLVPLLNFRFARPSVLVDLGRVGSLMGIERRDGVVSIGSMTRQRDAEVSDELRDACPLIPQGVAWVGHLQIRNRGTIGGNLGTSSPDGSGFSKNVPARARTASPSTTPVAIRSPNWNRTSRMEM